MTRPAPPIAPRAHGHAHRHAHDQTPDQPHDHAHGGADGQRRGRPDAASRDRSQRRLGLVLGLVLGYALVELVGGLWTGSLALLSDALHMISDSAALALSLLAGYLAARPRERRRTFGESRVEVLAALANGVALAVVALFISINAFERVSAPRPIAGAGLFGVATGGLAINLLALWLLGEGRNASLNLRGAFLHVASDTLASIGVCAAGIGIWAYGWLWLDPTVSLLVSALVLWSAWQLVRDALDVLMEAVPAHLDLEEIRSALLEIEGVEALHCLHVWTIGGGEVSLSSHLVVDAGVRPEALLERVRTRLASGFTIDHTTIQLEPRTPGRSPAAGCPESCDLDASTAPA